ncbi:hypothetical protein FJZ33_05575, partial [Candidatus Poribacteria bacterium]|nr:hypothetical protein [Candidatus Poribacteria bacterium]
MNYKRYILCLVLCLSVSLTVNTFSLAQWSVPIELTPSTGAKITLTFGLDDNAKDGYDAKDVPAPPLGQAPYWDAIFKGSGIFTRLYKDIKLTADTKQWTMEIKADEVTFDICWDKSLPGVPADKQFTLDGVDMRKESCILAKKPQNYTMLLIMTTKAQDEFDFGDAPANYPTLLANNGARHKIVPTIFLGSKIDAEADGQPNADATGDDNDADGDDEDGVTFTTSLIQGKVAGVKVVASVAGILNAWMDFNGNGHWADAGEQIFLNQALIAGDNNLTF